MLLFPFSKCSDRQIWFFCYPSEDPTHDSLYICDERYLACKTDEFNHSTNLTTQKRRFCWPSVTFSVMYRCSLSSYLAYTIFDPFGFDIFTSCLYLCIIYFSTSSTKSSPLFNCLHRHLDSNKLTDIPSSLFDPLGNLRLL